jgi:hypothetical protein
MKDEHAKKIVEELETMNCRLADISHFLNEIEAYGILNRELIDAIIAIARAQSKDFDDEYKKQLNMKPYEV